MSHHYGEDSSTISEGRKNFIIRFKNKETGAVITLTVPREGTGMASGSTTSRDQAENLLSQFPSILRDVLE